MLLATLVRGLGLEPGKTRRQMMHQLESARRHQQAAAAKAEKQIEVIVVDADDDDVVRDRLKLHDKTEIIDAVERLEVEPQILPHATPTPRHMKQKNAIRDFMSGYDLEKKDTLRPCRDNLVADHRKCFWCFIRALFTETVRPVEAFYELDYFREEQGETLAYTPRSSDEFVELRCCIVSQDGSMRPGWPRSRSGIRVTVNDNMIIHGSPEGSYDIRSLWGISIGGLLSEVDVENSMQTSKKTP